MNDNRSFKLTYKYKHVNPKILALVFHNSFILPSNGGKNGRTFRSLSCRVFTSEVMVMSNHAVGIMGRNYQGCENAGDRRRTEGGGRRSFAPTLLLNFSVRPCRDLKEDIECFHILKYKKYNVGESFGLSQEMLCIQKFTK